MPKIVLQIGIAYSQLDNALSQGQRMGRAIAMSRAGVTPILEMDLEKCTAVILKTFWVERRYPGFDKEQHLPTILALTDGNPSNVSSFCATIAAKG